MFWKYFSVFSLPTLDYGEVRRNTSALYLEKGKHIESSQNGAKIVLQNCNAQHFLSFWKLASFCALVPLRCTKWIQRVSKLGLCRFSPMLPLVLYLPYHLATALLSNYVLQCHLTQLCSVTRQAVIEYNVENEWASQVIHYQLCFLRAFFFFLFCWWGKTQERKKSFDVWSPQLGRKQF